MKNIFHKTYRGEGIPNSVCQVSSTLTPKLGNNKKTTKEKLYINSLNKSRCKIIFNKIHPDQLIYSKNIRSLNICKPKHNESHK